MLSRRVLRELHQLLRFLDNFYNLAASHVLRELSELHQQTIENVMGILAHVLRELSELHHVTPVKRECNIDARLTRAERTASPGQ